MSVLTLFSAEQNLQMQESAARKKNFLEWFESPSTAIGFGDDAESVLNARFRIKDWGTWEPEFEARYALGEPLVPENIFSYLNLVVAGEKPVPENDFRAALDELRATRYARMFNDQERSCLPLKPVCVLPTIEDGLVVGIQFGTQWLGAGALWLDADVITSTDFTLTSRLTRSDDDERWILGDAADVDGTTATYGDGDQASSSDREWE